jgi:hypothetical protein
MANMMGSILKKAKNNKILNIICCQTHERIESQIAKTGHNFYAVNTPGMKQWQPKYAPVPKNYRILDASKGMSQFPPDIEFDLILCQNKAAQYPVLKPLSQQLGLALVHLEHCLPQSF